MSLLLPPRWVETIGRPSGGDAGQPARHQRVVAVAVGRQKDSQHQRAALEASVVPRRRVRQRQALLDHVGIRRGAEAAGPLFAAGGVEVVEKHRFHRHVRERGLDDAAALGGCGLEGLPVARPPSRDAGAFEPLAEQAFAGGRQHAEQRGRFEHARAERVRHEDAARPPGLHEPRHAERRVRPQLERIAVVVVQPAENRVHLTETGDGLHEHAIVADGEIGAFDERKPEMPGEVRVLEVRLVVRTRREQHHVGQASSQGAAPMIASLSVSKNGASGWTCRSRNAPGNMRGMVVRFSRA